MNGNISKTINIVFQNIRGFGMPDQQEFIINNIMHDKIDLFGITETNLSETDESYLVKRIE